MSNKSRVITTIPDHLGQIVVSILA